MAAEEFAQQTIEKRGSQFVHWEAAAIRNAEAVLELVPVVRGLQEDQQRWEEQTRRAVSNATTDLRDALAATEQDLAAAKQALQQTQEMLLRLRTVAQNVSNGIAEIRDNQFVLAPGAREPVLALRKALGEHAAL